MSYGKSGRGLEAGGARNVSIKMPVPIHEAFTRTDSGYWQARAGRILSDTSPKLWGTIPVELYEGHHPDPRWDVKRNRNDGGGLGYNELGPTGATINKLRGARFMSEQTPENTGPYFEQTGVTPAAGKQPSAADVIQDLPAALAGVDWRILGLGALAFYWFFLRK